MTLGKTSASGDSRNPIAVLLDTATWSRETCPLCRTDGPLLSDPRKPRWRCGVCTQAWTPARLDAVEAYATFRAARGQ